MKQHKTRTNVLRRKPYSTTEIPGKVERKEYEIFIFILPNGRIKIMDVEYRVTQWIEVACGFNLLTYVCDFE